jgi:hypothetical protein
MHPRMPRSPQGTGRQPHWSEARRHAADLAWTVEQIDLNGRHLGPVDLHDLARSISDQILWAVGGGVEAPQVDLPIALGHAVDALQTDLVYAEAGDPAAAAMCRTHAALIAARLAQLVTPAVALDGSVLPLDGRSAMAQRLGVVPGQLTGAVR